MDFEKLGAFYLGKEFDLEAGQLLDRLLMYDARDLTTHAVCVGMTGSGKTGLCIDLLEEAAIDKVPALIIDPKGDMTNLLLNFPDLQPRDFRPWVNVDDARRKGLTLDEFAAGQAQLWKKGLGDWGQGSERMKMLEESAERIVFTPGSESGVPVSILQSFAAPPLSWDENTELLREQIQGIVAGLLGLVGVEADPVRSRENILMASIFEHFWKQGEDLDIAKLILSIQNPPIRKLGVFDVETFFPDKERFGLAMALNSIVASPAFQGWVQGHPLDIPSFLTNPQGKPRHSIFYIAHLSDAERMFFVTMLLNQVIAWMRTQSGTTSLRALIYMDEIFGFFPPVAKPPSKKPMLTLLKQARAFGLGVVLATQNPIDLDYKGLTNCGTWFIGRLQTERDKQRILDGLQGVASGDGPRMDRGELSDLVSQLDSRVFLMHNVHEDHPVTFNTRWAMSYLRGPMTRAQIADLKTGFPLGGAGEAPVAAASSPATQAAGTEGVSSTMPALDPGIRPVFLASGLDVMQAVRKLEERNRGNRIEPENRALVYAPSLLGIARVHFVDRRLGVDESEDFALLAAPPPQASTLRWEEAEETELTARDALQRPNPEAAFLDVPENINQERELKSFAKALEDYLYRSKSLTLFYNPTLKEYSRPRESERDFKLRLTQLMREQRDEEVDKVERKNEKRLQRLQDRLSKAHVTLAKKQETASARGREALLSVGESVLGMFLGRKSSRVLSSGMSKYRMTSTAKMAAKEAEESVEALEREIQSLQEELREETDAIARRWDEATAQLEEKPVTPRRSDIQVELFTIAWVPHWQITYKDSGGFTRSDLVRAI